MELVSLSIDHDALQCVRSIKKKKHYACFCECLFIARLLSFQVALKVQGLETIQNTYEPRPRVYRFARSSRESRESARHARCLRHKERETHSASCCGPRSRLRSPLRVTNPACSCSSLLELSRRRCLNSPHRTIKRHTECRTLNHSTTEKDRFSVDEKTLGKRARARKRERE